MMMKDKKQRSKQTYTFHLEAKSIKKLFLLLLNEDVDD